MDNLVGQSFGRYRILEPLGQGGMATVYKAYDTRLEREVAIKVIRTELFGRAMLGELLQRFEREAKALARLVHPNIVNVIDYGEAGGTPYLVMPYLTGGTLKQRLGRPIPWQEAARLLLPIARALQYAHQQGIVHRDVKPANILISPSGEPMLSDFGIVKMLGVEEGQSLTNTGAGIGTPEYMSPEQGLGQTVDGRTDIYSLGVIYYEMVTGQKPYAADTPMGVLVKHLHEPLPRPGEKAPGLPEAVENLLLTALAKQPQERYSDMGAFAQALEGLAGGQAGSQAQAAEAKKQRSPIPDRQASPAGGTRPTELLPDQTARPRRRPWLFWGWVTGVVALVVLVLVAFSLRGPAAGLPTLTPTSTFTPVDTATPASTPTSTLGIGSTWTRPADGMVMMYVPAGDFLMGSPDDTGGDNEHPEHTVYLDAFWIDQTEVTNVMYAQCVEKGACQPPQDKSSYTRSSYYGGPEYDEYPVIYVDWNHASAYCQWAGSGLPSEAQWEKAARGPDGSAYPWGNDTPSCSLANFGGTSGCVGDTSKAGSYPSGASIYGALDMAGNVEEWVNDWYGETYYSQLPQSNPQGPTSGTIRVLRGGSYLYDESRMRAAYRGALDPAYPYFDFGFRCARSLP
jgi:eukaryotic-like serine/threonine-protein kinase